MRFLLFLLGLVLGVAGTLGYVLFAEDDTAPVAQPLPGDPPVTVTLGEPFLTSVIQQAALDAPGVTVPPTAVRVELRDDAIIVHAEVEVLGRPTSGSATLRPVLRDDRLRVEVVETNLGSMPLPAIDRILEEQINARLRSLLEGLPVSFTGARVDRTRGLVITCAVDVSRLAEEPPPRS